MFKVGDKVRIKAELVHLVDSGKVFTVKVVEHCGYWLVDAKPLYYRHELELASATHFPIGTKVRVRKTEYYHEPASEGAEGVVVARPVYRDADESRCVFVKLTATAKGFERHLDNYAYSYRPEDLDIISLPTTSTQNTTSTNSYCEASTKATTPTIKLLYTVRNTHLLLNGAVEVTLFHEDATKEEETYDAIAITASKEEAKSIHLGDEYTVTIAKKGKEG